MKQGTCRKDLDPLALRGKELLHDPDHGNQCQTDKYGFEKDVHLYSKTDFSVEGRSHALREMKNVHNAVSDVLENLQVSHRFREEIETFDNDPHRTVVRLYAKETDELRLEFEVLEDADDNHVLCVLQRHNLSYRSAGRILDTLLEIL